MATQQYTIGADTRHYLDALNAFAQFKTVFSDALTAVYGEEQGEKFLLSHTEQFDEMERMILDYMRVGLTSEMGTGKKVITI